jgi:predicted small lipoprotein YifL
MMRISSLILLVALALSACGQKGTLYIEEQDTATQPDAVEDGVEDAADDDASDETDEDSEAPVQ